MRALASSAEPCFPTKSDDGDRRLRVLKRFALGLASCLLTQPSFAIDESVEVVEVGETRYLIYRIPRADLARGREWVPLNLAAGKGNFYSRPNGVFFVDDQKGAGVMDSGEYAKDGLQPRLATQSGPLLLRHRVIHPAFNPN
jgi:hypothetical protein